MLFGEVKAIYFDLDDTLCGYWEASKAGLREAFSRHGVSGKSPEEQVEAWGAAFRKFSPTLKEAGWYEGYLQQGEPTRTEQMRRTLQEMAIEDELRAQALSAAYAEARDRNLVLFPEALEVLETFFGRYPLGLITNGPADIQRQEVATLGIGHFFQNIFIEGEMRIGKPHAIVFERAQEAVGAEPKEILMVGNSYRHDIVPAIAAGWRTAWVRRPTDVAPSAKGPEEKPADGPNPDLEMTSLSALLSELP